jgi:ABC-type transport system involved in multi-copper enzyme maturation permease subunit
VTTFRLFLRANRYEMVGLAVLAVAALGVAGSLVARLALAGIPDACWDGGTGGPGCGFSRLDVDSYMNDAGTWGYVALAGIALLPILSGLLVGVVLVGKELDRGTATFAWSLTTSRRRWLLTRVVPFAVLVTAASLAGGMFADALEVLRNPGRDVADSFAHLTTRGVVVGAQALAFLGIATFVGTVLGRLLPALILSAGLVVIAYVGVAIAADQMVRTETVTIVDPQAMVTGDLKEILYQLPDGQLLSWGEVYDRYGPAWETAEDGGESLGIHQAFVVIPAQLYPISVARMSIFFGVIGLVGLVLTTAVVDRRRP